MSFFLAGLGTALPPHAIDQSDAAAIVETICCETDEHRRLLTALYRRSGVARRGSVLLESSTGPLQERQSFFPPRTGDDRGPTTAQRMRRYAAEALPLASAAAASALADASIAAERVTHLVTVSCSGFAAPGWDVGLIESLVLSRDVARTHVGFMGCHGALNGLRVAKAFADADPNAVALVVALELCSLHHRYGWEPDRVVSNALFADGSAAVVGVGASKGVPAPLFLGRGAGGEGRSHASIASFTPCRLLASGSTVLPDTADAMTWHVGDHGFEMTLSPRVPDLIHTALRPWLESWLAAHDVPLAAIGSWAVHPGGPRVLSATAEALSLPPEALAVSRDILREHGNMSSPTVLFLLDRLRRADAPRPTVALGFGPGLTIEAALFG